MSHNKRLKSVHTHFREIISINGINKNGKTYSEIGYRSPLPEDLEEHVFRYENKKSFEEDVVLAFDPKPEIKEHYIKSILSKLPNLSDGKIEFTIYLIES